MNNIQCTKCDETKTPDNYSNHKRSKNGKRSTCRACCKVAKDKWDAENKAKIKAYSKMYYKENKPAIVKKAQVWRKENRDKHCAQSMRYKAKNGEKTYAHNTLNSAIRFGRVVRPESCETCGIKCVANGHHEDYSKPFDVVWLCGVCHSAVHADKLSLL